jgi:diguanylate cyclase (GGDEF)-like protein
MPSNSDLLSVRDASVKDALTGGFTRPYFVNWLDIERKLALESGKQFALCLVDVDQLRNVNDAFGQQVGNQVLRGIADRVRGTLDLPQWQNLRCLLARYDGDSLILLLPGCRERRAEQFAHVLRRRIAASPYESAAVTCTIAVAAHQIGESVDALLARTEKTLHLAKQFGSDSVETAATPESRPRMATVTRLPVAWHRPPTDA